MALLTRLGIGFITLVTVLPLSTVGTWWVRLCDFPRLQIAAALFVPLAGLVGWSFHSGWTIEHSLLLALCMLLAGWQLSHAVRYSPLVAKELEDIALRTKATTLSVVNLKYENSRKEEVLKQLQRVDSDLLLLIEFDRAWASGLAPLAENYAFKSGVVKEKGLGLMLWSKYPLQDPQVRYLVSEKRPSIFAQLELPNRRLAHFVGLHPTPPGLWQKDEQERHDSRIRDAELLVVANLVADAPTMD